MRRTVGLLVAALVAALPVVLLPGPAPATVALPAAGSLVGDVASDGTPVWVGHRRDDGSAVAGDVWVVDATAPSGSGLTARCGPTAELVDPVTGDRYDLRGRSIDATTATGLTPLRHTLDGDVLVLVDDLPAYPTLPYGGAETAPGRNCLGPDGPTGELERHPADQRG